MRLDTISGDREICVSVKREDLNCKKASPKSLTAGCQVARCGRRRMSGDALVSMLLNGGCGYEDF